MSYTSHLCTVWSGVGTKNTSTANARVRYSKWLGSDDVSRVGNVLPATSQETIGSTRPYCISMKLCQFSLSRKSWYSAYTCIEESRYHPCQSLHIPDCVTVSKCSLASPQRAIGQWRMGVPKSFPHFGKNKETPLWWLFYAVLAMALYLFLCWQKWHLPGDAKSYLVVNAYYRLVCSYAVFLAGMY